MSRLKLNKLTIENFKGIEHFEQALDGGNARIIGQNETKKTTIADAYNWLFSDKSSDGKPSSGKGHFGLRPHLKNGHEIHDLTVMVEAAMAFDGQVHVLRKEQTENKVNGVIRGYPNQYYVDGPAVLKKDFDKFISNYVPEDVFKLLTDVFYFCGELHHSKRREFLVKFAEGSKPPQGYDGLLERAGDRKLEDYKKALVFERDGNKDRDGYKGEAAKIPTRIEELLRGLVHPTGDTTEMALRRDKLETEIQQLKIDRQGLFGQEQERQKKINAKNLLIVEQKKREGDLVSDTSSVKALMDERTEINTNSFKAGGLLGSTVNELSLAKAKMTGLNNETTSLLASLNTIRTEYKAVEEEPKASTCYACKQSLPADIVKKVESERKEKLEEITQRGNDLNEKVKDNKLKVFALDADILDLSKKLEKAKSDSQITLGKAEKRVTEIDEAIKTRPTPVPQEDEKWLELDGQIQEIDKGLGEPVADQLEAIETQRTAKETELEGLNKELAQADRIIKDKARITELEEREKELAQLIADIEKELALIKQYNRAYSEIVEAAVNDKFKYTTFKLFDIQINGEIDDRVCEAMNGGTSWADMSTGQSIKVGNDVINTLSKFYDILVPRFIDNAQDITTPIESSSQTIALVAQEGVKQLQVQTKTSVKKAVA